MSALAETGLVSSESVALRARRAWSFPPPRIAPAGLVEAAVALGFDGRALEVLVGRGITTSSALAEFLAEPATALHDPGLLPDADVLVRRIELARERSEPVVVFGDFDADGLTGLAVLARALRSLGVAVEPYVPSRLDEGHGLSLGALEAAERIGSRLIVTVDTGSSSVGEIAAAAERAIDVVVTDHHRVPPVAPPALGLVNPHRADATYPDSRLSGAGIAFKVAQLLVRELGAAGDRGRIDPVDLADLAAIGTVADLAPVLGENRAIARLGLARLRCTPQVGLAALLTRAGIAPGRADLETIAFAIAPRLNAAGRVGDAGDAARLLLTDDPDEAAALAERLEAANGERRELTRAAVAEARGVVEGDAGPILVRGAWPVGVVGLVAARLVEDTGRPAVVATDTGGVLRASCRSDGGLDLAAALEACADLFTRHGGHPGAAGFELPAERWDAFRERFALVASALATSTAPGGHDSGAEADPRRPLRVELALEPGAVDYALLRDLARLEPTGPGHPEVLVAIAGLAVARVRPAAGGHSQLTLRRERDVLDAIAFGRDDLPSILAEGDRVDVVGRLQSRAFGGFESIQVEVRDIATQGVEGSLVAALQAEARSRSAVEAVT
jgi:single-stranded-DNA-specific exonuclease